MEWFIGCCALISDIVTDGGRITILPHRRDEIAVRPKFTVPQLPLDLGTALQHLFGGQTFDQAHNPTHAVRGHRLKQKMHMVAVCANFDEGNIIAQGNVQQTSRNTASTYSSTTTTILSRTHQMIQQHRDIVALMPVANLGFVTHGESMTLSSKAAASCGVFDPRE